MFLIENYIVTDDDCNIFAKLVCIHQMFYFSLNDLIAFYMPNNLVMNLRTSRLVDIFGEWRICVVSDSRRIITAFWKILWNWRNVLPLADF